MINDDYLEVKKAMEEAGGIVLSSPNKTSSATAQMKALFDRSSSLLHCQVSEGGYGIAAVTSGAPESKKKAPRLHPLTRLQHTLFLQRDWT